MAGKSSRFLKAGYEKPKYQLEINDKPLFDYCISSFKCYFHEEVFVFVVRSEIEKEFVLKRCVLLDILNYEVVVLDIPTRGQAETVYFGLKNYKNINDALIIFNIDTIRPCYQMPELNESVMGYLEVFEGDGDGWSFVDLKEGSSQVLRTTEKVRISNLCSTGLYFFKSVGLFKKYFEKFSESDASSLQGGEYYIAPMYNLLINAGLEIISHKIDSESVIFSGVPSEYESLVDDPNLLMRV